ncbi:MAG: proprotein convertase P-domain-containing protein [Bacteroidota bacterium]
MKSKFTLAFLAVFLMILTSSTHVSGQNYSFTTSGGNAIVPGAALVAGSQADDVVINVPLPFSYTVYGTSYASVGVSTNGNLQFTTANSTFTNTCPLPTTTNLGRVFMPFWEDCIFNRNLATDGIFTSTSGVAPNRIFNIEWRGQLFSTVGSTVNFEARLFEGQQRVDFIYATNTGNGVGASIGVQREVAPTTFFTQFSCNTASLSSGLRISFVIPPAVAPCVMPPALNFTQNTPTAIPTGPAVVTSTLVVAGAPTYLYDLNLTTFLTHTFAADLDITIQSPAGTVVTLTTDNGAGNDNVFNGTVWDDDANPAGQVPYTTNNGLATDHAYVNLTTATPLAPEEPLGAFIGENPNGTWTITISDDLAGDGGSLNSWTLAISALPSPPVTALTSATNNTPVPILDVAVVTSTLNVAGAGTQLLDLNLTTFITHTFAADLDITIMSPAGTVVTLTTDNGAGNDDVFNGTVWDDDANPAGQVPYVTNNGVTTDHAYVNLTTATPLTPEEPLAAFIGEDPNGTWTITISDDLGGDVGTLNSWTLNMTTSLCPIPCTITCPANITTGNTPGLCGAIVNYPAPTTTGPCGTVTAVPASGSFFPIGTTTVTATTTAGPSCTFTITVTDTEPPVFINNALVPERLYYKFNGVGATVPNQATAPPPGTGTANLIGLTQGNVGKCGGALVGAGTANQSLNTNWATNMAGNWTISFWLGPNQIDNNPSYLWGDVTAGAFRCFYGGAALTNNVLVRGGSGDVLITGVNPTATFITVVYNGVNTVVYKNGTAPQTYAVTFPGNTGPGPFRVGGYSTLASVNGRLDEFGMYSRALSAAEVLALFNACPLEVNTCPSNMTVNTDPGLCSAVVNYTTPVGIDNCPGVTTIQTQGLPSGSAFPVGTTTNNFRATDAVGNITNCTFNVTVVDNEQPVFSLCPPNVVRNTDPGFCYATYTPQQPTFTDNCGVTRLTWVLTPPTGPPVLSPATGINYVPSTQFQLNGTTGTGVTTIVYTATDAAGNTRTCTFTVTVNDASIPVITTQPPATKFVCVGSDGTFTVIASAGAGNPLAYQWQIWSGSAWVNAPGASATTATLVVPSVSFAQNTNTYRCVLTGRCSVVISGTSTLYINPLPSVTVVTSIPPALVPGQSLNISSTVSPGGGTYQWYRNGVLLTSPLQQLPVLSGLTVNDIGTYRLVYTDLNGCVNNSADVVISGQPSDKLWVYPVPNNGTFQVRFFNSLNESATVRVWDAKGAKVYERAMVTTLAYTSIVVDLGPAIADGVYIVELVNGAGKRAGVKKIVVRQKP